MRTSIRVLAVLALVATCFVSSPVRAATFEFPGAAPCNTTLQACIDGLPSGSTIEIATNTPIAVNAPIDIEDKSLTIRPKPGFKPVLEGDAVMGPRALTMFAGPGSPPTTMRIIALTMREMQVRMISQDDDDSMHEFVIRDSRVGHSHDHNNTPGVALGQRSPSRVSVLNNVVRSNGQPIQVSHFSHLGPTYALIEGNRVEPVEDDYAANGIETRADGTSLQTTDVFNNVILDSGRCFCGNPAGISTFTPTGANGRFNIVGNTIHRTADPLPGIWVIASEPTTQVVNIFNNSFSNMDGPAFRLPENSPGLKVQNGYNNIFNAGAPVLGHYKLGPHTTNLNPRYRNASEGNFRLNGSSPLIDRGRVCQIGGLGRSDAARHFRLARASVDIGAYEYGSNGAPPTGRNLFGTGGANTLTGIGGRDILCGFGGRDVLRGKGAADWVEGGDGRDRSYGQGGADIVRAGTGKRDLAAGGPGPDLVVTKDGSRGDLASGGKGDDTCRTDRRDRRRSC
jgi:hypothetical protein